MRICFAGPEVRIILMKKTIGLFYDDIDPVYIIDDRDYFAEDFYEKLKTIKSGIDAMIFTGELHYNLYNKIFFPEVPCEYIKKDWSTLQNALLAITLKGIDFTNISIDSYPLSMVDHLVNNLNISLDDFHLIKRAKFEKDYSHSLFMQHKELYESGKVKGCLTAMYTTYLELIKDEIPCTYAVPTTDVIVKTVNRTRKLYFDKIGKTGNLAILIVRIMPKKEYSYIRKDEYLYMHEKMKVAEEIYFFARDTNAAIVNESIDKFVILMNRADFIEYTNSLQSFYLVNSIFNSTNCDINVGVGYGFNPGEAKFNANLAIEKASPGEKNATYIVTNSESSMGPLYFLNNNVNKDDSDMEDEYFQDLARKSGLSQLKIYTLYSIIEKTKRNTFTSVELSTRMDMSLRSVNRMLKNLENAGLAKIVSKKTTGGKGRPRDIYELSI